VVFAGENPDFDLSVPFGPREGECILKQVAVHEDEETIDAPIVPPVYPACLDLFAGEVEILQHLLKRQELEDFVALVRRINLSQALIDNRINQDDIVLRHLMHYLWI
jgi:hypothetical protein